MTKDLVQVAGALAVALITFALGVWWTSRQRHHQEQREHVEEEREDAAAVRVAEIGAEAQLVSDLLRRVKHLEEAAERDRENCRGQLEALRQENHTLAQQVATLTLRLARYEQAHTEG